MAAISSVGLDTRDRLRCGAHPCIPEVTGLKKPPEEGGGVEETAGGGGGRPSGVRLALLSRRDQRGGHRAGRPPSRLPDRLPPADRHLPPPRLPADAGGLYAA